MTLIHIVAGLLALLSGFVALYSPKGRPLHRKSGTAFAWTMLIMCFAALMMTVGRSVSPAINIPAALLTACLVATSLTAVAPLRVGQRKLDLIAFTICAVIATFCMALGVVNIAQSGGFSAFPHLMFGPIALLAALGDWRVLRQGPLQGTRRVGRHLWRMTCALLIASMSFFLGQADIFPKWLQIMPLLALPVLAVLLTMLYWLWRVRWRQRAAV